jgi:corrinoid protein of di/trimethylamine methyltransferase
MSIEMMLEMLRSAVLNGDEERAKEVARSAVEAGFDPLRAVEEGLSRGLRDLGELFERREVFLPELVIGSEAMKAGLRVLQPVIEKRGDQTENLGRVLIGTVTGDIHDIGKNLVATLLTVEGFEVHDLGVDVSVEDFIENVKELRPDILAMSALLTMSILEQEEVVKKLNEEGLRDSVIVLVGGAPVTQEYAERIGADGYGVDGFEAVRIAKQLTKKQ